jgi:carboxypeptidase Taq
VTAELQSLRRHMAELSDLGSLGGLLFWDQQTMMPPGGAVARSEAAATLARVMHARARTPTPTTPG